MYVCIDIEKWKKILNLHILQFAEVYYQPLLNEFNLASAKVICVTV